MHKQGLIRDKSRLGVPKSQPVAVLAQRASESHRELAQTRLRHADALRIEMEGVRGKLRVAEEDAAHKQGLISHNNHQVTPRLTWTTKLSRACTQALPKREAGPTNNLCPARPQSPGQGAMRLPGSDRPQS